MTLIFPGLDLAVFLLERVHAHFMFALKGANTILRWHKFPVLFSYNLAVALGSQRDVNSPRCQNLIFTLKLHSLVPKAPPLLNVWCKLNGSNDDLKLISVYLKGNRTRVVLSKDGWWCHPHGVIFFHLLLQFCISIFPKYNLRHGVLKQIAKPKLTLLINNIL